MGNPDSSAVETFSFLKGGEDILAPRGDASFDWDVAASVVRQHLADAANAKNLSFLLGSGCSSLSDVLDGEVGIPTMGPMAKAFLAEAPDKEDQEYITKEERRILKDRITVDVDSEAFQSNLERLLELLYSARFLFKGAEGGELKETYDVVDRVIEKTIRYVIKVCTSGKFDNGDNRVLSLYEKFYRKLVIRDRSLPRPWIFTTNYDLFNEKAMDRRGIPYCNGFSGSVERRFNPAFFKYTLAEQLDISNRKWSAVDGFVYLCKLHGSINWVDDGETLYPVREIQKPTYEPSERVMIYPTPSKQSSSFASPYVDLFREFHSQVVRDQSVLVTIGYSFGDEHVNNIIFQAMTIPNFRLIAFVPPGAGGVVKKLSDLNDPRVWMIGGSGRVTGRHAHYFDTFVEDFMPDGPGNKIDDAVSKVLSSLISKIPDQSEDINVNG